MRKLKCISFAMLLLINGIAVAQDARGRGPEDGPDGRGAPPPPEQRMLLQINNLLGANATEWSVLEPKIERIQLLLKQRERFAKAKPPPPPRPPARDGEPAPPPEPQRDPNLIVDLGPQPKENENTHTAAAAASLAYANLAKRVSYGSDNDGAMSRALEEFREARKKSDEELAAAREELRNLVTNRQEIILVVMGILD